MRGRVWVGVFVVVGLVVAGMSSIVQGATEEDRAGRQRDVDELASEIARAVPLFAEGVVVAVEPVFEGGEFVRGYVVRSASRPAGVQVSGVIGEAVRLIDGRRSVAEVAAELARVHGLDGSQVGGAVASAAGILYVDGVIAELRSPA